MGPEEASRLLLATGIHALVANSYQNAGLRLIQKFDEFLFMPLDRMRTMARDLNRETNIMFMGVYRPMFLSELEFLVGERRAAALLAKFPDVYTNYVFDLGKSMKTMWDSLWSEPKTGAENKGQRRY